MKREKRGGEQVCGDRLYECESCNKKFARKAHLQRHEKAHLDFRPYVCTICEQKFKAREGFLLYIIIGVSSTWSSVTGQSPSCSVGKVFLKSIFSNDVESSASVGSRKEHSNLH